MLVKTRSDEGSLLVGTRSDLSGFSEYWTEAMVLGLEWSSSVQGKPNVWLQGKT